MVDQYDVSTEKKYPTYDLHLGLYAAPDKIPTFLKSKNFLKKVVQAKFFNGETSYKQEELPILQELIKEKGAKRLRQLFVEHILKFKEESRSAFPNSILDKLL